MKNYYDALGLTFGAELIEIKKAYRTLAIQFHPDKNSENGSVQRFYEITEAYEILKDKNTRQEYDILLQAHLSKSRATNPNNSDVENQKTWSEFGQQKAKEYSEMSYEAFINRIKSELKIGSEYIPNLIMIIFFSFAVIGGIIGLINGSNENNSGGVLLFVILLIMGSAALVYLLTKNMIVEYRNKRNDKFNI